MLDKRSHIANKGWSFGLGFGWEDNNPSP